MESLGGDAYGDDFGIMIISAIVFKLNYNGNIFYSFFSAREFMLGFVGPGIFLLCRCGLPVQWGRTNNSIFNIGIND